MLTRSWNDVGVDDLATAQRNRLDEAAKAGNIREQFPVLTGQVYLNTGTNGPLPRAAHEALGTAADAELREGRVGVTAWKRNVEQQERTREQLAVLLGCAPLEVALMHNTTEGMNVALMGLDWRPGDEVISAVSEHPGGLYPIYLLKQRYGVRPRLTRFGLHGADPVDEVRRALTPKTRAVVISHVAWSTGMVLPLREIAEVAHAAGAVVICDGAQGAGHVATPVEELGVDAYTLSGQKWLCGPDGTGALYVRQDRLGDIAQTFIGYHGVSSGMSDYEGHFVPPAGAVRYEVATLYGPAVSALGASLRWIGTEVGWEWAFARAATLGAYCHDRLTELEGVAVYTPRERMGGLVHFAVDGIAPPDLTARLADRGVAIRHTPNPVLNRVSLGFYNTEEDVDRFVAEVVAARDER